MPKTVARRPRWRTKPKNVRETLQRVRRLLDDKDRWCKESYARDANGHSVTPDNPHAVRWCLAGACTRVDGSFEYSALMLLTDTIGGNKVTATEWNDDKKRTHAQVLKLVDRAIKAAACA